MRELAGRLPTTSRLHWRRSSLRHDQLARTNNRQFSLRRFANDELEVAVFIAAINLSGTAHDVDEFESVGLGQQETLIAQGDDAELLLAVACGHGHTPAMSSGIARHWSESPTRSWTRM